MGNESGTWIMHGLEASDKNCIHTVAQLTEYIDSVGFLPLFKNDIDGFSVEEHVESTHWWSGDRERDPWEWREIIAAEGKVAYGKFFDKKAGFVSLKMLPDFVNCRRDGYDFDALWDDEKASVRQKKIMDLFDSKTEMLSNEIKQKAGFGGDGEKNFEGVISALQMEMYLCVRDFRQRRNKKNEPYGWPVAVYCMPEHLWDYDFVTKRYSVTAAESAEKLRKEMEKMYPKASQKQIARVIYGRTSI